MQPILGNYYEVSTRLGPLITQAISQDSSTGEFYGSISPSSYEIKGDNVSIGFSEAVRGATQEEELSWVTWYTPEEINE